MQRWRREGERARPWHEVGSVDVDVQRCHRLAEGLHQGDKRENGRKKEEEDVDGAVSLTVSGSLSVGLGSCRKRK